MNMMQFLTRTTVTLAIALAAAQFCCADVSNGKRGDKALKLKSTEVFIKSSTPTELVWGSSFYTRKDGFALARRKIIEVRDDTVDESWTSFSVDNGRTWSEWESVPLVTKTDKGAHRRYPAAGFVDPKTGRLITMVLEGVLPNDDPLDGMTNWFLSYRVSLDGGRTNVVDEQCIQKSDFTPEHPFDGIWVGKNSIQIGSGPYFRSEKTGKMIFPMQMTPLGPDGKYYNPSGGMTYTCAVVLIGEWGKDNKIEWEISEPVWIQPEKSIRGAIEPTVAEMPDGRMLMVMRGSNDSKGTIPGYKWFSVSTDGGYHWSKAEPWTYDDGTSFYSPGSISQLLKHSNGRVYWFGNITPENPRGNGPRYPIVAGEVDPVSLKLIRKSVTIIDDRKPEDPESLQLSNFQAREDRQTGDIVLHLTRWYVKPWGADAMIYRLAP